MTPCPLCDLELESYYNMAGHMVWTHFPSPNRCLCGKELLNSGGLTMHLAIVQKHSFQTIAITADDLADHVYDAVYGRE